MIRRAHEQLGARAVYAAIAAVLIDFKQRIGNRVDGGTQLLLCGLDLGRALGHLRRQTAFMRLQFDQQACEIAHQQCKQQTQGAAQGEHAGRPPSLGRGQAERPLAIGQGE